MEKETPILEDGTWAVVELFGHSTIAGQVSEVTLVGTPALRIDVPGVPGDAAHDQVPPYTKFYGGSAIYALTPTDEVTARHVVAALRARPIATYVMPTRVLVDYGNTGDEPAPF